MKWFQKTFFLVNYDFLHKCFEGIWFIWNKGLCLINIFNDRHFFFGFNFFSFFHIFLLHLIFLKRSFLFKIKNGELLNNIWSPLRCIFWRTLWIAIEVRYFGNDFNEIPKIEGNISYLIFSYFPIDLFYCPFRNKSRRDIYKFHKIYQIFHCHFSIYLCKVRVTMIRKFEEAFS